MKQPPQSIAGLRDALAAIFPSLPGDVGTSGESVFAAAGPTCDSLMRDFTSFFERNIDRFSDRQLRRLAELVVGCVAAQGALARAMDTCSIASSCQTDVIRRLNPFLTAARDRAHG